MINILGFAGIESYDILVFLGKVLHEFGMRVLLVDKSETGALSCCIPRVDGWENDIVHHQGIDFAIDVPEDVQNLYDWVLVDYGKTEQIFDSHNCTELYLVTDYQKHNIEWLSKCSVDTELFLSLIFRDRLSTKINKSVVSSELECLCLGEENILQLNETATDLENKVLCQYNAKCNFTGASESFKQIVISILHETWSQKDIKSVMKRIVRRK